MERGLDLLLEPVVAGVSKLRTTAQLSAISMAVTALGEAWTEYILRQKIRFRFVTPGESFFVLFLPEASFGLRVLSLPVSVCVCVSITCLSAR